VLATDGSYGVSMRASAPRLSYVVAADRYETVRSVVDHLRNQSVSAEVELVVATPSSGEFGLPDGLQGIFGVQLVEVPLLPAGRSRARAVGAARGEVVVLGETHTFPSPDWAEKLLQAHERDWTAVAPGLENGNPVGALSWAGFLMDYGRWLAQAPAGRAVLPPDYNAAWKREALLSLSSRLEELLEPGGGLPAVADAQGGRFVHAPSARVAHVNVSRPRAWARERFLGGRLVAAARRRNWSLARRLVYLGGAFLIPLVRLIRTMPAVRLASSSTPLPRGTFVALVLGCLLWGAGEAVGYAAGVGGAQDGMLEYEMHKLRYASGVA
jgi:hypothetical protein